MPWHSISLQLEAVLGQPFSIKSVQALAGGDINTAFCIKDAQQTYFVKLNRVDLMDMFAAEFAGLQALAQTKTLRVPKPLLFGQTDSQACLVLEHIEFGRSSSASDRRLGQQLALLHQQPQAYFGWHQDNTIGSSLQINQANQDWSAFWRDQRLGAQLKLAAEQGYQGKLQSLGAKLASNLDLFFKGYTPVPALVHGDLWGGNVATDKQGNPVIFDPACYFADRETDLAMTELFGGFSTDFYAGYQEVWPLHPDYKHRKALYNLYHILNHLNLFGGGYLRQAETMMAQLIAELR